ncbi:uncharacterized protein LOC134678047 [Cydia fagiglandana]|uniref:uncharacterized protein LOC134678047 n=1 Tax=Cydia fagiglandana TaxID=1458189 RepID=UPI002FEE0DE8
MSSFKVLKCASCNIVVSELLAFVQHKSEVMDNESIIRICATAFTPEEIVNAKSLLFESVTVNKRKISRRNQGKSQRDLEDIITLFKETDSELIPTFVAKDLHKLPPVTFDHIDVTRLLKDLLIMQSDLKTIKESYVTSSQLEEVKNSFYEGRYASLTSGQNVNKKRGAFMLNDMDSGPIGLIQCGDSVSGVEASSPPAHQQFRELSAEKHMSSHSLARQHNKTPISPAPDDEARGAGAYEPCARKSNKIVDIETDRADRNLVAPPSYVMKTTSPVPLKSSHFADVVKNGTWEENKPDAEWMLVQRKKLRNQFIGNTGKASPSEKFKAAITKVPLFISNVHRDTTSEDIAEYIRNKTSEVVKLEKVVMKRDKGYDAYKFFVNKTKLNVFLNDTLWPDGIKFRRYVYFKSSNPNSRETARDSKVRRSPTSIHT